MVLYASSTALFTLVDELIFDKQYTTCVHPKFTNCKPCVYPGNHWCKLQCKLCYSFILITCTEMIESQIENKRVIVLHCSRNLSMYISIWYLWITKFNHKIMYRLSSDNTLPWSLSISMFSLLPGKWDTNQTATIVVRRTLTWTDCPIRSIKRRMRFRWNTNLPYFLCNHPYWLRFSFGQTSIQNFHELVQFY